MRRQKIIKVIGIAVVCFLVLSIGSFLVYARLRKETPILMYHMINDDINPYVQRIIVPPAVFEKQMKFLKDQRYTVIPLRNLAGMIRDKKAIPSKTVAITFDDGNKDNFTIAFKILQKYNFQATMFIIVNEVGRSDRLSWQDIATMQASGLIDFGSHCLGPEPLVNFTDQAEVKREIVESKRILEEKLKTPIRIFSYPEGLFNQAIRQQVIDAGYEYAVATKKTFKRNDCFSLRRIRVSPNADPFMFWALVSGYYQIFKN